MKASPLGPVTACFGRIYLFTLSVKLLSTWVHRPSTEFENRLKAPMVASPISATTKVYSMTVAPSSDFKNDTMISLMPPDDIKSVKKTLK